MQELELMRERDLAIEICIVQALRASSAPTASAIRAAIEKAHDAWTKDISPVRTNKEQIMRFADVMHERDLLIELFVLNTISPASRDAARGIVREAIKKADKAWVEDILPARVGSKMAKTIAERLNTDMAPR